MNNALLFFGLVVIPSHSLPANGGSPPCILQPSLYVRHREAQRSGSMVAKEQTAVAYYGFFIAMGEAAERQDETSLTACYKIAKADPIASQFSVLVRYLKSGRKDAEGFLNSLPHSKSSLMDFWDLDAIYTIGHERYKRGLPGIRDNGFLFDKYVDELVSLIVSGKPQAADRFVFMYTLSDGYFAEWMDEEMLNLLKGHFEVIVRLWNVFGRCGKCIPARDDLSEEDFKIIGANAIGACNGKSNKACLILLKAFDGSR